MEFLAIYGTGGCAKDAWATLFDWFKAQDKSIMDEDIIFVDRDSQINSNSFLDHPLVPLSTFDFEKYAIILSVGFSDIRQKVYDSLPLNAKFFTLVHPQTRYTSRVEIGEGSIITAGCTLTTDIKIGRFSHLNLQTTIAHDCQIGDFFTTAPGANISGNCRIGDRVYVGTNAAIKQGITICDDVTIGMGAVVVKDITEPGVYAGVPAKKIK